MLVFEFKNFPTHVRLSSKKSIKINTQNIFNGKLHSFSRAKAVEIMKHEISKHIPKVSLSDLPVAMFMELHVPYNYGNVRLSKGVVKWKPMENPEEYTPTNDLDNMSQIWSKCFQDCLVSKSVIPEDTIQYVTMLGYKYIPCETLDDRKIVVSLIPIRNIDNILSTITSNSILGLEDLEILNSILKL